MRQLHPEKYEPDSNERDDSSNNEECSHLPSIPPDRTAGAIAGFQTETLVILPLTPGAGVPRKRAFVA